jgi:hypothetical protein
MAVQQKGANGLIAEYSACEALARQLEHSGLSTTLQSANFRDQRDAAETRVGNELNADQIRRARRQGDALGQYIFQNLTTQPSAIGIASSLADVASATIEVRHVGSNTGSGVPEDIEIVINLPGDHQERVPISLKAYRSGTVSLGSKSAKAALSRLFLNQERCSDAEFCDCFGPDGVEFLSTLDLFKKTSKLFYDTDASKLLKDQYEARKGTRKINNPLRRKELGEFFHLKYGFVSEHRFNSLFCRIFNNSFNHMRHQELSDQHFVQQLRFILGNPEVLALNAVAETVESEVLVDSSFSNEAYLRLNSVLRSGLTIRLIPNHQSSHSRVEVTRESLKSSDLSLAVWKDATIQFKLHA